MTFLAPLFLFGLIFIGLPIIIHLWFRKRLKRIPFSTLQFLKTAEAKRIGWLRLREILTLISRCCVIAFLVMSLSRPVIEHSLIQPSRTASVVIIIDNSYSMQYGDAFSQALENARRVIARYSSQAQIAIIPLCNNSFPATDILWTNAPSAIKHLDSIKLTMTRGSLQDIWQSLPLQEAQYDVDVIYIGDGQRITFEGYSDTLPEILWLQISSGGNCSIASVMPVDPIALPKQTYDLMASVKNYGNRTWQGTVSLFAREYAEEHDCVILPQDAAIVRFSIPITRQHGEVVLHDDSIVADNHYYFSKDLPTSTRTLLVGNNRFIMNGLQPSVILSTPFIVTQVNRLSEVDARAYDVVILSTISEISSGDRSILEYIARQEKKSVICFLGQTIGPNYLGFLSRYCQIKNHMRPTGYVTMENIDHEHPVFTIFKDNPLLRSVKIFHYRDVESEYGVLAEVTGNHPFIIDKDNVCIITTDFIPHATDIMYSSIFVPLLYRLIMYSSRPTMVTESTIGDTNNFTIPLESPTHTFIPPGKVFPMPGLYSSGDTIIAVNVDPEEGNTAVLGTLATGLLNIKRIEAVDLTGTHLSLLFLICALVFLLFEVILLLIK